MDLSNPVEQEIATLESIFAEDFKRLEPVRGAVALHRLECV